MVMLCHFSESYVVDAVKLIMIVTFALRICYLVFRLSLCNINFEL